MIYDVQIGTYGVCLVAFTRESNVQDFSFSVFP